MDPLDNFLFQLVNHGCFNKGEYYVCGLKDGNVLFNNALNTFYFTLIWRRLWIDACKGQDPLPPNTAADYGCPLILSSP